MEQIRDLAIVLKWVPFEERHRIVTALTEQHGKISALARNSIQSRRFGAALEPFAASEWLFVERRGANLFRVEEAHIRRSFDGLRQSFERLSLASAFNELVMRIAPEREPCPELFKLHSNALAILDEKSDADTEVEISLLNGYIAKLLQWSGNQPQIQWCMGCEISLNSLPPDTMVSCMVSDAGWICENCRVVDTRHVRERQGQKFEQTLLRVSPLAMKDLEMSLTVPIRQLSDLVKASQEQHRALFYFLESLLIYHSPGFERQSLKSLRFLGLESSLPPQSATFR